MRPFSWLERQSPAPVLAGTVLLMLLLGWIDFLTGTEVAFSVFYFLPVAATAYFVGRGAGLSLALASTITWLLADVLGGQIYSSAWVEAWNTMTRLISFLVLAVLTGALRRAYDQQEQRASTDPLTGASNRRRFLELLDLEISRARRSGRPLTLVLLDLDGFKAVNDRLGHGEGDAVLRAVVETFRSSLRETDVLARLGGDEFAILLPDTAADAARRAVSKLRPAWAC